ncbi:MAG: deoxyribonuclease IV [Acidimicrobiales bacterium]
MQFGAHVRAGKGLVPALRHGSEVGAEVIQIHAQSPRTWRPSQHGPEVLTAYREAQAEHPSVAATFCHATYLINLATPDPDLAAKSRSCLGANLATAAGMGSAGLVLHTGSHRGAGLEASLPRVVAALVWALDAVGPSADGTPILLENTAGAGHTIGRSFEELAAVIEAAGGDERLGVCLDTQHLWASGVSFGTVEEADALVELVAGTVGLDRLQCLHVNDSKVPLGANRDRHANIGDGEIGAAGFAAFLGHPRLQGLPAVLEVPGAGQGPRREDVARVRQLCLEGLALRS